MSASQPQRSCFSRRARTAVLGSYLLLALAYSIIIPHAHGPDETRHYDYVCYVARHWEIPLTDYSPDGLRPLAQHPPVYYWLVLPFYLVSRPGGPTATYVVLRLVSVALGLGFVLCTAATAGVLVPRPEWFRWYVAAVVAVLPNFLLYAAVIHNDILTAALSAFFLWLVVARLGPDPPARQVLALGLLTGVGSLTKGSLVIALPFAFALLLAARLGLGFWRRLIFWRSTALLVGTQAAVAGWWYLGRLLRWGALNLMPPGREPIPQDMSLADALLSGRVLLLMARGILGLFRATWAEVGWIPHALEPAFYVAFGLWALIACVSLVAFVRGRSSASGVRHAGRFLVATPVIYYVWVCLWVLYTAVCIHPAHYQCSRYTLPGAGGLALFLGMPHLMVTDSRLRLALAACTLALLLATNAASIYNLIAHLVPTHAPSWNYLFF